MATENPNESPSFGEATTVRLLPDTPQTRSLPVPLVEMDSYSTCVFLEVDDAGNERAIGSGCFFMRRDIVLTAAHVIEDVIEKGGKLAIANGMKDGRLVGAKPLASYRLKSIDLALVKVSEEGLHVRMPLFPSHYSLNNAPGLIAAGYARTRSSNTEHSWTVEFNHIPKIESYRRERTTGVEHIIEFDAPWLTPGFSGGPIITIGGGVAGVMLGDFSSAEDTRGSSKKTTKGRATAVYPILELFESPFDHMTVFPPSGSDSPIPYKTPSA